MDYLTSPQSRFWPLPLLFLFIHLSLAVAQDSPAPKQIKLVIDPGHGGRDPGRTASSKKYSDEKVLNLLVAHKLAGYIKEHLPQVEVLFTREKDEYKSLDDRVEFANKAKADYFLSIHFDANPNSSLTQGASSHIQGVQFASSKKLAEMIQKEFADRARRYAKGIIAKDRRGHNLQVLQYTEMPGVLIECGYLTNPSEEQYVNTESGQAIIASAIFRAFRDFVQSDPAPEDRTTYYKVQIAASQESILTHPSFRDLENRVEEHYYKGEKYGYRYLVGREYRMEEAKKLQKLMEEKGHKTAFIVKFHPGKAAPDQIKIGDRDD